MGSRVMHVIIANKIADSLSIKDKTSFLLGSIAPDATSDKVTSHFFKGDLKDYSRYIDYKGFLQKYKSQEENLYILGYYSHLIADDIWLKGFYLPWLKNRIESNEEILNLYHNDFRLLNSKLLEYYSVADELRKMLKNLPDIINLEEVNSNDVEKFLPYVLGDMEYDREVIDKNLNVFTFTQIVGYIETALDMGVLNLEPVLAY